MAEMSISQVTQQTGVRPSALRYYEEIGLLRPARRISGRRQYDVSVLQRLAIIQTGQQAGFTLAELRTLLNNIFASETGDVNWQQLIDRKLGEMDRLLHNIQSMKRLLEDIRDCDDASLAECIVLTGQKHQVAKPGNVGNVEG